jgi:hypothetical protein
VISKPQQSRGLGLLGLSNHEKKIFSFTTIFSVDNTKLKWISFCLRFSFNVAVQVTVSRRVDSYLIVDTALPHAQMQSEIVSVHKDTPEPIYR